MRFAYMYTSGSERLSHGLFLNKPVPQQLVYTVYSLCHSLECVLLSPRDGLQ